MIRRLFIALTAILGLGMVAWAADGTYIISLKGINSEKTERLGYANISFKFLSLEGNVARVAVSIDNISDTDALLVFRNQMDENILKKNTPKIEFDKSYAKSESRTVQGVANLQDLQAILQPADYTTLLDIDIPLAIVKELYIPIYLAKYNPNDLQKGRDKTTFKIFEKKNDLFKITVTAWTENDPDYVAAKTSVDEFLDSLDRVKFCDHPKHNITLSDQQRPYIQVRDSLVEMVLERRKIKNIMSTDDGFESYEKLIDNLKNADFNKHVADCGEHKRDSIIHDHSCILCSLSEKDIYHSLDDLYQNMRSGKITKAVAVRKAKALYYCYQMYRHRKKTSFYTKKISSRYNSIVK